VPHQSQCMQALLFIREYGDPVLASDPFFPFFFYPLLHHHRASPFFLDFKHSRFAHPISCSYLFVFLIFVCLPFVLFSVILSSFCHAHYLGSRPYGNRDPGTFLFRTGILTLKPFVSTNCSYVLSCFVSRLAFGCVFPTPSVLSSHIPFSFPPLFSLPPHERVCTRSRFIF